MEYIAMNGIHNMLFKRRFFEKVNSMQAGECWNWDGVISAHGYGDFWAFGRRQRAHRISWEIYYGKIPEGKLVLHKCDNKRCINPAHLYLGTNSDNMKDHIERSENPTIGCFHSRLTLNESEQVKTLHKYKNFSQTQLAELFDVSRGVIYNVLHGNITVFKQQNMR